MLEPVLPIFQSKVAHDRVQGILLLKTKCDLVLWGGGYGCDNQVGEEMIRIHF